MSPRLTTRGDMFAVDCRPLLHHMAEVAMYYDLDPVIVTIRPSAKEFDIRLSVEPVATPPDPRADERMIAFAFLSGACAAIATAAMVAGFLMVFRQQPLGAAAMLALYVAAAWASGFLFSKSKNGRAV